MEIPVFVEPIRTGFRASMLSPIAISAEGATESGAIDALSSALSGQLPNGGKIKALKLTQVESVEEICTRMRSSSLHAELEKSFEDYRKVANAREDVD